jgi:ribonuclease HI
MMTLYQLWMARNDARERELIEDPRITSRRTVALVEEWDEVNCKPSQLNRPRVVEHWLSPPEGWIKLNTDGSFRQESGIGGGGAVLRDHHGRFIAGSCHFFPACSDPERAELLACRQGLRLAMERGEQRVILEVDSTNVVRLLKSEELDRSAHGPLVEDIKVLLRNLQGSSIKSVRREANEAAHRFAKDGCDNKLCRVWTGVPLVYAQNLVVPGVA